MKIYANRNMNYITLYETFINSRRTKTLTDNEREHSEIHHIKPLWAFPGDYARYGIADRKNVSNKIRLTYADHFFAHLLLAKIYGEVGWRTVRLMLSKRNHRLGSSGWRGGRQRYAALTKLSNEKARKDQNVYALVRKDGETFTGTTYQFRDYTGICLASIGQVISGKTKSTNGWRLSTTSEFDVGQKGEYNKKIDRQVREFVHLDGRTFSGTQFQFRKEHKLRQSTVSCISTGRKLMSCGWRLASTSLADVLKSQKGTGEQHCSYNPTIYSFVHADGKVETCTMYQLRKRHNLTPSGVYLIAHRKYKRICGWSLADDEVKEETENV